MVGFCNVEAKSFGPDQFQEVTSEAAPIKVKVFPTQIEAEIAVADT